MKIENIKISNFKAFKDIEIKNVPRMAVFVGANGTGKTTLFNVFIF
jgi:predicted ATPase